MKIHILTIGDEILIGQTLNTNAAFIGELLNNNNYSISSTSVVGDNVKQIADEIDKSLKHNDIVLCTGGLGPTNDDVTLHAITEVFKTELVENEEIRLARPEIESYYQNARVASNRTSARRERVLILKNFINGSLW